jgi:hypothetical protein
MSNDLQQSDITADRLEYTEAIAEDVKADLAQGIVEGYASTFGGEPDRAGDVIAPGAFRDVISAFRKGQARVPFLWAHDTARPIGRVEELREDAKGLFMRARFNLETPAGRDAYQHAKSGDVSAFSIGYRVPPGGVKLRASKHNGTVRELRSIDLWEVSLVTLPANTNAQVTQVKSVEIETKAELVDLLRRVGLSKAAAKRVAAGGYPALRPEEKAASFADDIKRRTAAFRKEFSNG